MATCRRKNVGWLHLYEISKVAKLIETERGVVVVWVSGEEEIDSCCSMAINFKSSKRKSYREVLNNIMLTVNNIVVSTLKFINGVGFMLCFIYYT